MVERKYYFPDSFVIVAFLCSFFIYTGIFPLRNNVTFFSLIPFENIFQLSGKVISNPIKKEKNQSYICNFSPSDSISKTGMKSSCKGIIRIQIPSSYVEAFFPGKLFSISKDKKGNEMSILCEKGANIVISGTFSKDKSIFFVNKVTQTKWDNSIKGKISYFRALYRLKFRRLMYYWEDAGGLFLALLSGIREYTSNSINELFRNAGLSHILALSGMHLSLFSGLTKKITEKTVGKKKSYFFQLISICIFVWFAGFSPSLFRAFLCNIISLVCSVASIKNIKMINILALSFIIHIIIFPLEMLNLAFQLSYGALAGILIFGKLFCSFCIKIIPSKIANDIGSSTGAQFLSIPITAIKIGIITPIGIISSIIITPLINIFIYIGLLFIILSFVFPFFSPVAAFFMKIIYSIIIKGVMIFSNVPPIKI